MTLDPSVDAGAIEIVSTGGGFPLVSRKKKRKKPQRVPSKQTTHVFASVCLFDFISDHVTHGFERHSMLTLDDIVGQIQLLLLGNPF